MKMGVRYSTVNTVVEFEENRRIAWQTGPKGKLEPYVAGRIWRYELESRGDRTLVRESWDITGDHQRVLLRLGDIYSKKTRRDMELTLARLDALLSKDVNFQNAWKVRQRSVYEGGYRSYLTLGQIVRKPVISAWADAKIITYALTMTTTIDSNL